MISRCLKGSLFFLFFSTYAVLAQNSGTIEGRGILRGPQTVNFDLSAAKNFPIKARLS